MESTRQKEVTAGRGGARTGDGELLRGIRRDAQMLREKLQRANKTATSIFSNTGGNDPIELMEREGINYFNNPLVAELQGSCYSQTTLLLKLKKQGLLVVEPAAA